MFLKLIFIFILTIFAIVKGDLLNSEIELQTDDNEAILIRMPLTKLNRILIKTEEINEYLRNFNIWLTEKDESFQTIVNDSKLQMQIVNESLNNQTESFEILQNQNVNFQRSLIQQKMSLQLLTKEVLTLKKFLNKSLDLKSLNQNREWTVIQRRQDGSEDFYRNWSEYKRGFGNPNGEFFIGLEKLHAMTSYGAEQELLIVMEDFENQTRYAKYDKFVIGSELEKYILKELGDYSGDAGDSLTYHLGQKFTTKDQDNDNNELENCASLYLEGAWWFDNCFTSHLNGPYIHGGVTQKGGINWIHWHGNEYSLKFVEMMIRSVT